MNAISKVLGGLVPSFFQRPDRIQVAALCWRDGDAGREVLMITSRDTGRWILPKGWPMDGRDAAQSAMGEAWEEAGVAEGEIEAAPLGTYAYDKVLDGGVPTRVQTRVFAVKVVRMDADYPEAGERRREWMTPAAASRQVAEPELARILADFR
jgi:8-oxo-dGTP pyrophosphatase MutT (NUDIX family)